MTGQDRLLGLGSTPIAVDLLAPGKINLALAVGPRGEDGYHPLVSVMQQIDLCDELRVELRTPDTSHGGRPGTVVFAPALLASGGDTLVTRAGDAFIAAAGLHLEVRVHLRKRIPMGAGLGGGSSDAGTLLKALNRLAGNRFDAPRLAELAASIGSDVPFFALSDGAALVSGRGEHVLPVEGLLPATWLIAFPAEHATTGEVYQRYVPNRDALPEPDDLLHAVMEDRLRTNDLAVAALAASPRLRELHDVATALGAHPLVCGSGSSLALELAHETDQDPVLRAVAERLAAWPGSMLEAARTLPDAPIRLGFGP